jgi:ubiquinone/menaquinone biosynthesis C-methylase UbiE
MVLAVARTKVDPKVTLRQGRAENLPFADEAFDVVVSSSVLHYLRAPDAALREMRRVLKPGGRVVICDWCDDYLACRLCDRILRMVNRAHHKTYGRSECISMLQLAGFEEVDLERFKITWLWGLMTASGTKPA